MHRVRVFLNGAASSSAGFDWQSAIRETLFRSEVDFVRPKSAEQMQRELVKASREKIDVVISVGGDGTFNTLIQTLANTDTSFLVIPAGTANDLARELGITKKLRHALESVRKNEVSRIDLLKVNDRYMATNGGIGIVSDVAFNVNNLRYKIPGFRRAMKSLSTRVYSMALAGHLLANRYRHYKVRIKSKEFSGSVTTPLLLVNNQPYIAGSFPVAPETMNADGKFNVTIFTHEHWFDFVDVILRVKRHLPVDHDRRIISFETAKVEIELLEGDGFNFFGDGEFLAKGKKVEITALPQVLKVFRKGIPCFKVPGQEEMTV